MNETVITYIEQDYDSVKKAFDQLWVRYKNKDTILGLMKYNQVAVDNANSWIAGLNLQIDIYPDWDGNEIFYYVDNVVNYNGTIYKVLQDHKSQPDWDPVSATSLFTLYRPQGKVYPPDLSGAPTTNSIPV